MNGSQAATASLLVLTATPFSGESRVGSRWHCGETAVGPNHGEDTGVTMLPATQSLPRTTIALTKNSIARLRICRTYACIIALYPANVTQEPRECGNPIPT